jgi:hypothetical protein
MNIVAAKKKLVEVTTFELVPIEEYQDIYYYLKKIKSIFPELSDEKIAGAIDFANKEVKISGKKKYYIDALSFKMFLS